jgi:hypothetical protein
VVQDACVHAVAIRVERRDPIVIIGRCAHIAD